MELTWQVYNPQSQTRRLLIVGGSLGGDTAHQWSQVAGHLSDDTTVVFVYLPGQGIGSAWDDSVEPTMENLATALAETINVIKEGYGKEIHTYWAGLSLSGALGLYLARDYPELLRGIIVVASAAKLGTEQDWLDRAEQVEAHGTGPLVEATQRRWFTEEFVAEEPAKVATIMEGLASADHHSYAQLCRALASHDMRADLDKLYTPMMLLAGEFDESTPLSEVELILESAHEVDMRIVRDVAHQVTVCAPGTVADILRIFFRRLRSEHWNIYEVEDPSSPVK